MLYNWKAKYCGMHVSEAKRLKALEDENAKLKKFLADAMLGNAALNDLLSQIYGPPCPCKGRSSADDDRLHKCICALASGALLRPGHEEIRAQSQSITPMAHPDFHHSGGCYPR